MLTSALLQRRRRGAPRTAQALTWLRRGGCLRLRLLLPSPHEGDEAVQVSQRQRLLAVEAAPHLLPRVSHREGQGPPVGQHVQDPQGRVGGQAPDGALLPLAPLRATPAGRVQEEAPVPAKEQLGKVQDLGPVASDELHAWRGTGGERGSFLHLGRRSPGPAPGCPQEPGKRAPLRACRVHFPIPAVRAHQWGGAPAPFSARTPALHTPTHHSNLL